MSVNTTFLTKASVPARITKVAGHVDLFVIEDLNGSHMGYCNSPHMARMYFAAPGMLAIMERMASLCLLLAKAETTSPELKTEALEIIQEANTVMTAASRTKIL